MTPRPYPLAGDFNLLSEALAAAAEQFGDRDAYVEPGNRLSFGEWHGRSNAVAAALWNQGIRPGDVVAIMLPSSNDFATLYTAAIAIGAVATGINTRLGPSEVAGILQLSGAALLVCENHNERFATERGIPALLRHELPDLWSTPSTSTLPPLERSRGDAAIIIWTSGTTGMPKGAWYDHAGLEAAVHSAGVMSAPFDRRLVSTPFAHAGYMAKVWEQLAWGITFVVSPVPWSAESMKNTLRDEEITVAGAVPTQWAKLLELPLSQHPPFPTLRLGISATAPASPQLIEAVRTRLGVPLVVRYAMTESPSIAGTEPTDAAEVQFRTVGRAQSGMQVRVLNADGLSAAPGAIGAVVARGRCVMRGYWGDEERTRDAIDPGGWLQTGDLGSLDDDGLLRLTGRSGDMYIRGGYNVYPLEVEKVLEAHPAVKQAVIVGTQAPVIGEIGVAFLVSQDPGLAPSLDELRQWTLARLADYKAPDELIIVAELPLTAMLKVDRQELKRRALATDRRRR